VQVPLLACPAKSGAKHPSLTGQVARVGESTVGIERQANQIVRNNKQILSRLDELKEAQAGSLKFTP
jgi:hypothetical protein